MVDIVKKLLVVGIILLLVCVSIPSTGRVMEPSTTVSSSGNTLYVGGSGEGNYTKIQDAIDNASLGDIIFVYNYSSPYMENIIINLPIKLKGEDRDTTVIDGGGVGDVIHLSDISSNVSITGFTITGGGNDDFKDAGIDIHSSNNIIYGNNISNNIKSGIQMKGNDNYIHDNIISNNHRYGIRLIGDNNLIKTNFISNSSWGLVVGCSNNNYIVENTITQCRNKGVIIDDCDNTLINGNTITFNGIAGLYIYSVSSYCSGNIVSENNISSNELGLYLGDSKKHLTIRNNFIDNNINADFFYYRLSYCVIVKWINNYWDNSNRLLKPIFGWVTIFDYSGPLGGGTIDIPWVQFDLSPAREPFDI